MPRSLALLLLSLLMAAGCDEPAAAAPIALELTPRRSAAEDQSLRRMMMDLVEAQTCEALMGRFLPLPEDRVARPRDELPITVGRLWVDDCSVERTDGQLAIHVGGRGWQWTNRTGQGPFGSSFRVRGNVRMATSVDLITEADLRYEADDHRFSAMLTPTEDPRARVRAIGSIPIASEGGWSGIVGGLGGLLGAGPGAQAGPMFEQEGAAQVRRQLGGGLTVSVDLCTLQPDVTIGALADGEAPPARPYDDGLFWLDNSRGLLVSDGLDVSGPYPVGDGLVADVEVESGSELTAALVCHEQATSTASSYLSGGGAAVQSVLARGSTSVGAPAELLSTGGSCEDAYLVVWPTSGTADRTVFRMRVRPQDGEARSLVDCD